MNRAQCIKCGPWPPFLLAAILLWTPQCQGASLSSARARDPWLHLSWTLDSLPGPATLFEGGLAARQRAFWVGRRQPFGLPELSSNALAIVLPTEWGCWQSGVHVLSTGWWREGQIILDWQPPGSRVLRPALGVELRELSLAGRNTRGSWLRGAAAWRQGPLRLWAHLQQPVSGAARTGGGSSRGLGAGWRLGPAWGLCWSWEASGVERMEQAGVVWEHRGQGLSLAWRAERGWEVAGRLSWRNLSLSASWWSHPVLPATPSWGLTWREIEP